MNMRALSRFTVFLAVAFLLLARVAPSAQVPAGQTPKPTPAIQKALEDALKIQDPVQKTQALKTVLESAKAANDLEGQAEAEDGLGNAAAAADQIPWFEAAVKDYRAASNRKSEAVALYSVAYAYTVMGKTQEAVDYFKQAIPIFLELGDKKTAGRAVANLGRIYGMRGQTKPALEQFLRALDLQKQSGDTALMGTTISNIGAAYFILGQPRKALDFYGQAIPIEKQAGDKQMLATTLTNMGNVYVSLGQPQNGLDYYDQALATEKELGNKVLMAGTLSNIGILYGDLGQSQKALDYYGQALDIEREAGDRASVGHNLTNIGVVYAKLGQSRKALEYFDQALPILKEIGDMQSVANTLGDMGVAYGDLGQPQKALDYYNQLAEIEKQVGDKAALGVNLNQIGVTYRDLRQYPRALNYFNRALLIVRELGDRMSEGQILDNVSDLLRREKSPALAVVFGKQSVNTYQAIRKNIKTLPQEDQDAYSKQVKPTYRHLADLLIKQGRLPEAEKVMNLLKDEENFEFVARDPAAAKGAEGRIESIGAEAGWWSSYQKLQDQALKIDSDEFELAQRAAQLRSNPARSAEQAAELAKIEANLNALESQKEVLDKAADAYFREVGVEASTMGGTIRKEAEARVRQTGDALPQLLGRIHRTTAEKVGAVYALASSDELDFLIVTYAGRAHVSAPVSSDALNEMISDFRKNLMDPSSDPRPAGEKLYHSVFEKVIHQLREAGCNRVVWCLDGALRYVPIGALWDGKQYLIQRGDFTMFDPLNLDRMSVEASKSLHVAGFAATHGKGDVFAPLPGADRELKSVVRDDSQAGFTGAVPGRVWENQSFDAGSLTAAMTDEKYSLLHIATHFSVGKDFNSSQLLLGDGNLLSLKQFTSAGAQGRLGHMKLVCLSACDTAESFGDSTSAGSQFSSFASLTLHDGANSVVASLWPVSDASTPLLMKRFYSNWMAHKGLGKAEALRQAQLSLLISDGPKRPFAHPYYWAPFILFGNWK